MPINNQVFSKKSQAGILGKLVDSSIDESSNILNALDFIESPQGFATVLSPVQRMIIRAFFGIPFDYRPEMPNYDKVVIWDKLRDNILYEFKNEAELLYFFYEEGRCNISNWKDIPPEGFNEAAIFAGRRGGKALSVEEVVPTPTGFKRMGDLKTGDTVLSNNGKPVTVLEAFKPFWSKVYKISFDDGTYTLAHPEHLWKTYTHLDRRNLRTPITKNKRGKGAKSGGINFIDRSSIRGTVRTTEEIREILWHGEERNQFIPLSTPVEFEEKQLPLDPYCLGVWLGDGAKCCGIISSHSDDAPEILSYFTAAGFAWKQGKGKYDWSVYGLPMRKMNLWNNKHIPEDYLYASISQRLALLQGLMDTDGYCARDGQCEFSNTNRNLAEGVYHLAASLGLKPYWKEGRATLYGRDCGPYYAILWTATLPVFRLKRKLKNIPKKVRDLQNWRTITAVEYAGETLVRCIKVDSSDGLFLFGKNFNVTHNSQVVSAIGGYALYRLLNVRSPQDYYGLRDGSSIDFTFMAADDEGSNRLYDKLRTDVNASPFFTPYIRVNTNSEMAFVSEADRHKRDILPSIRVASYPCTTNALRGPSSLFLALDEFAHFRAVKGSSSDEIYESATPATIRFKADGGKGRRESMILSISSPWQRIGKMYELHKLALEKGVNSGIFTLRCSTTEMWPDADGPFLHQMFMTSPLTWKAEYGGEFLDSSETYVKEFQLAACINVDRTNITSFHPSVLGHQYFWGLDLGMQHDGTALAIGHLNFNDKIGIELVYDYIDRMIVDEAFDGPGVDDLGLGDRPKYVGYTELPLEDIVRWLKAMHDILPCFKGVTDQHGGAMLVQLLQINGIDNMELVHLTPAINSEMYYALKGYIDNGRTRFPNVPKFLHEIKQIEAQVVAKYQLRVRAPEEKGSHDDMCDSVALVAWQAMNYLQAEGKLMLDPTGLSFAMQERGTRPPAVIRDISNVPMRDIKIFERFQKIQQNITLPGREIIKNPFHKRGRHR